MPATATKPSTTAVACVVWARFGHCTRCSSAQDARRKAMARLCSDCCSRGGRAGARTGAVVTPWPPSPAAAASALPLSSPGGPPAAAIAGGDERIVLGEAVGLLGNAIGLLGERLGCVKIGVLGRRDAAGAADERGVELVDIAGVAERGGQIGAGELRVALIVIAACRWVGAPGTPAALLTLLRTFAVTGQGALPR